MDFQNESFQELKTQVENILEGLVLLEEKVERLERLAFPTKYGYPKIGTKKEK